MRQSFKYLLFAAVLTTTGPTTPVAAQQPPGLHLIVVQGSPRKAARAEVHVMGGPDARNVIVVDKKATAADLDAAVQIARHLRAEVGDTLSRDIRAVARPSSHVALKKGSAAPKQREWMGENLVILDRKKPEEVPGFGKVKYLDLVTRPFEKKKAK